jgi:hypothetical protein
MAERFKDAPPGSPEGRVNALDVALLDVLAQAEAMLRCGHEIQRSIVTLRGGDGSLTLEKRAATITKIRPAATQMSDECNATAPLAQDVLQAATHLE